MNVTALLEQAKEAREAGFVAAATDLERKAERARKLVIAYEHYRYVKQETVDAFNAKLKAQTSRPATAAERDQFYRSGYSVRSIHDKLVLHTMELYPGLPPTDVLAKVKEAKGRDCFDKFEVAEIQPEATHVKLPDPIVFGLIDGCTDRFYIAEWGSDVSITDLLQANEG